MTTLPHIYVCEFAGSAISYRISIRRARDYWEFLDHVGRTFNKPWDEVSVHFHLDNDACRGRVSASEWNAGSYFEPEFLVDNNLLLFAHFENLDERTPNPEPKIEEGGEAWSWGWSENVGLQDNWYDYKKLDDEQFDEWEVDPYPPFPLALPGETPPSSSVSSPSGCSNTPTTSNSIASLTPTPPPPTSKFAIVDDCRSTHHLEHGIIVGTAKAIHCRNPNVRPVVRAILSATGAVCGFIDGKYAKKGVTKGGVRPISMKDVDYIQEFAKLPRSEKRLTAVRHELQRKLAIKRHQRSGATTLQHGYLPGHKMIDQGTKTHKVVMAEGIVIGHARPDSCRDPQNPPVVRAALNKIGALRVYIPAKDSLKGFTQGRLQIPINNVVFSAELAALSSSEMQEVVKERIMVARGERGRPCEVGTNEGGNEQQHRRGYDQVFCGEEEVLVDIEGS